MKHKFATVVEVSRNLSIIAVALIGATVLVRNYLLHPPVPVANEVRQFTTGGSMTSVPESPQNRPGSTTAKGPSEGAQLSLPDMAWSESAETVLLALSDSCHFCTESAPFYQQLAREVSQRKDMRLVAVFPQDVTAGKKYLAGLGVPITEVRQIPLNSLGVRGTPTLIIVDKAGVVKQAWVGRLSSERESEVLSRIRT